MSPKLTFTICSAVSFLFSISFYVFAEFFTKITFPQAEGYLPLVLISLKNFITQPFLPPKLPPNDRLRI